MVEFFLITLAVILLIIGLLGCIIPMIPGPPLAYIGMLCLHFTDKVQFSATQLIVWGILVALTLVLDSVVPIIGTKLFGGTKYGKWGSLIGSILGMFILPWGILLGPFLGAFIGELIGNQGTSDALKSGVGSFLGFIVGTGLKVVLCAYFIAVTIDSLF